MLRHLDSIKLTAHSFNTSDLNEQLSTMDTRVRKAVLSKIEETVSNASEIKRIRRSINVIQVRDDDDFIFGIAIGRIYNSFYYQTRRNLKRDATDKEFEEFLLILGEESARIKEALLRKERE